MTTTGEAGPERELTDRETPARRGRIPADTFANRLLLARRLAGMTIKQAALACGLNYGSWSNWEAGKRPIDILNVAEVISERLDIDRDWLLFGGQLEGPRGPRVTAERPEMDSLTHPQRPPRARVNGLSGSRMAVRPPDNRPAGRAHRSKATPSPMVGSTAGRRAVLLYPPAAPMDGAQ